MGAEKDFEKKVKDYIKSKNCWGVKFFANKFTKSGIPDLLTCINGYFVSVELKALNGKPSELQLYNQKQIRNARGIAIILYPNQFSQFKKMVESLIENKFNWSDQFAFDRENNK